MFQHGYERCYFRADTRTLYSNGPDYFDTAELAIKAAELQGFTVANKEIGRYL